MNPGKFVGFLEWMDKVEKQDNRATMPPILITLQTPEITYNTDGWGPITKEGPAKEILSEDDLEGSGLDPDETLYQCETWVDRAWFFTYEAYEEHLRLNAHNYRKGYRNYVQCLAYRNPEAVQLFEWLKELKSALMEIQS